jgi:hypothetical protein
MDDAELNVMRLAGQGLSCSQILITLALQTRGENSPGLVRALAGLAYGCGLGQGTCGVLTGSACVLALYAGKSGEGDEESPAFLPMLEELNEWFAGRAAEMGTEGGAVTCSAIIGPETGRAPQAKCGSLVAQTHGKVMELLMAHGFDPTSPSHDS